MRSARTSDAGAWRAVVLILALTPFAWFMRFVQDDAYISFRYARHLVEGHGLVFNPGEAPVEGYTNFLWTLLVALAMKMGLSPESFVYGAGLVLYPLTMWGAYRLGRATFSSRTGALVGVFLLGTNFSFVSYATGGLETMLQACLVVWVYATVASARVLGAMTVRQAITISLLAALAGLTRMDTAVLLLPAGVLCALMAGRRWRLWSALVIPVGVIIGAWLVWKWSYYGALLPNTFQAKMGASPVPIRGVWYLVLFGFVYALWLLLCAHLRARPLRDVRSASGYAWCLLVPVACWCAYIVYAGGDFMEFRFIIPMLALVMLLIAAPFALLGARASGALLVVYVLASAWHGAMFERMMWYRSIESIPRLASNLSDPRDGWLAMGERLNADLGHTTETDDPVRIALMPAGAIGYASRLPVLDMFGLNDAVIARDGVPLTERAGHRKVAKIEMLLDLGGHLVIAHPRPFDRADVSDGVYTIDEVHPLYMQREIPDPDSIPDGAMIVAIPATPDDEGPRVMTLYLQEHPAIDDLIERGVWWSYPIRMADDG